MIKRKILAATVTAVWAAAMILCLALAVLNYDDHRACAAGLYLVAAVLAGGQFFRAALQW